MPNLPRTVLVTACLAALLCPRPVAAQAASTSVLVGRVGAEGRGLAAAEVRAIPRDGAGPVAGAGAKAGEDGSVVTLTGDEGGYRLAIPPGRHVVEVRAIGYHTARFEVEVGPGEAARRDVELRPSAVELDPLVVTGTMTATRVSESPAKVEVVPGRVLERSGAGSLMESIGRVNGLYEQVDCAVCYTNSIRINGMEGPYTAVLIDGMPIMGALASVYGLNGIDPTLIEQLEIVKGPQSTLYGSEAMGGVVNVITKDTRFAPRWSVNAARTSVGATRLNGAAASDGESASGLVSGSFHHADRFVDENGDGFTDEPLLTRLALFGKLDVRRDGRPALGLAAKVYHEERFGGVEDWTDADRGSDRVYGEYVLTRRAELMGRWDVPRSPLRAELSYAYHDQESYYGDQPYLAEQQVAYGQLLWDAPARRTDGGGTGHDLLAGLALRAQEYDDDTPATAEAELRLIPGVFVQDEWRAHRDWTLLSGLRADHHGDHGLILSPRLSVMWQPREGTILRLNGGTGFRVVNLFTEDHAALTGARRVVIEEELAPERSRSLAVNINQVFEPGGSPVMIDVDLFHTRFSNRIRPDYDTDPDLILYRNLSGHAVSRGVAVSLNQNFLRIPLLYSAGVTIQDVYLEGEAGREEELFAPDYRAVWSIAYTFPGELTLDWSGAVVGPMRLPVYPAPHARPTRSPAHAVHDVQATWEPRAGTALSLTVENLADFTQGSPLIAPEDPFGDAFDTNYVWGPIAGRRVTLGVRLTAGR